MPKYIQRRLGRPHKVIQGIEHKYCGSCKKLKPLNQFGKKGNGKRSSCKPCRNKKTKQRRKIMKEKREKAREAAPTGFLVCLYVCCTVKELLQPVDQFIGAHVRNDEPTMNCLTCRDKQKEADKKIRAACLEVWVGWRKTHPCVKCMNDPNYEHNYLFIEADHLGGKVTHCSNMIYWSHSDRGVPALRAELMTVQALCKFHHALVTQQRDHDNGRIQKQASVLRKRAIMYAEKHKRGCCLKCKRVLKKGEERAFHFDHRDASTKFMYQGNTKGPSDFVGLPDALFATQWPLEKELVDMLCANCHALKDNRDGYRKTNKF
jgi:hypothetical protein